MARTTSPRAPKPWNSASTSSDANPESSLAPNRSECPTQRTLRPNSYRTPAGSSIRNECRQRRLAFMQFVQVRPSPVHNRERTAGPDERHPNRVRQRERAVSGALFRLSCVEVLPFSNASRTGRKSISVSACHTPSMRTSWNLASILLVSEISKRSGEFRAMKHRAARSRGAGAEIPYK